MSASAYLLVCLRFFAFASGFGGLPISASHGGPMHYVSLARFFSRNFRTGA